MVTTLLKLTGSQKVVGSNFISSPTKKQLFLSLARNDSTDVKF